MPLPTVLKEGENNLEIWGGGKGGWTPTVIPTKVVEPEMGKREKTWESGGGKGPSWTLLEGETAGVLRMGEGGKRRGSLGTDAGARGVQSPLPEKCKRKKQQHPEKNRSETKKNEKHLQLNVGRLTSERKNDGVQEEETGGEMGRGRKRISTMPIGGGPLSLSGASAKEAKKHGNCD